jgi:hypothetical protein
VSFLKGQRNKKSELSNYRRFDSIEIVLIEAFDVQMRLSLKKELQLAQAFSCQAVALIMRPTFSLAVSTSVLNSTMIIEAHEL